jgi:acetoin utilization deacetylase AcuC-like enzyme
MVRVYYSPGYVGSAYAFDTTRKARWVADSLSEVPVPGIELAAPGPLTREQVAAVHELGYVRAIETGLPRDLAESQGFGWDPGLWPMVLLSNGGVVAAALAALQQRVAGSLSSGLHHARRGSGAAFCTFNGLVIAAREALAAGAGSVLILDLDAHCGGGTAALIQDDPRIWQIDVSVTDYDGYSSSGRVWLDIVQQGAEYLAAVQRGLDEADRRGPRFGLCLYNAGMDPRSLPGGRDAWDQPGHTGCPGAPGFRLVQPSGIADCVRAGGRLCWPPSGRAGSCKPSSAYPVGCRRGGPNRPLSLDVHRAQPPAQ